LLSLNNNISEIKKEISGIKKEFKNEISGIKNEISEIKNDISDVKQKLFYEKNVNQYLNLTSHLVKTEFSIKKSVYKKRGMYIIIKFDNSNNLYRLMPKYFLWREKKFALKLYLLIDLEN